MGSTSNGGADASSAFELHDNTPKLPLMMVRGASSLQQQPPTTWLSGLLVLVFSGAFVLLVFPTQDMFRETGDGGTLVPNASVNLRSSSAKSSLIVPNFEPIHKQCKKKSPQWNVYFVARLPGTASASYHAACVL